MSTPVDRGCRALRTASATILVIEADLDGRGHLADILGRAGHCVVPGRPCSYRNDLLSHRHFDLVIADIDATPATSTDLLDTVRREAPTTAVIILTENDDVWHKIDALRSGADDFITKPCHPSELAARVEAVVRRLHSGVAARELSYAGLRVDLDRLIVTRDDQHLTLTPTELRLLILLLENAERVVSKSQILDQVWQYDFNGESLIVEKVVSNLRKKVDRGSDPLIQTIRGFGYSVRRAPRPR